MSSRAPLSTALSTLRATLEDAPGLRAVAFFGSAREGRTWGHSDIDLIAVVDADGAHWESRMLWWEGWEVHFQTLSAHSLTETAGINRGSGLARALGSADIWFDRGGELSSACRLLSRMDPNARDLAVLRSTARAVAALHEAERHQHFGRDRKARLALAGALEHLAALRVAELGELPPREAWEEDGPERAQVDALLSGAEVGPILVAAWSTVRVELPRRCAVLLQLVGREGPIDADALGKVPLFIGIPFSERLMTELVDAGLLSRTTEAEAVTGLPALRFERTKKGRPDVFPAGDPALHLDREAIGQVLTNLLSNASKYGADGHWVGVKVRDRGDFVTMSVADRGMGIAADELKHVFDEFFRSEDAAVRRKKGTGIGLAIVRYIVEAHGGSITVNSTRGSGTTFTVSLPTDPPDGAGA